MGVSGKARQIDAQMEKASHSLAGMEYFKAERVALRALARAHATADFDRMARILLPLQEARRQKRQLALEGGALWLLTERSQIRFRDGQGAGCYLLQPPLVGVDGRTLRNVANRRGIPVLVVTREPLTRSGQWPVVSVGEITVRARVCPPEPMTRVENSVTKDTGDAVPDAQWFVDAAEQMGRAAIASIDREEHIYYQVDALMQQLDAHPDDEALHQHLADTCRAAVHEDPPTRPRKRPLVDDLDSF